MTIKQYNSAFLILFTVLTARFLQQQFNMLIYFLYMQYDVIFGIVFLDTVYIGIINA